MRAEGEGDGVGETDNRGGLGGHGGPEGSYPPPSGQMQGWGGSRDGAKSEGHPESAHRVTGLRPERRRLGVGEKHRVGDSSLWSQGKLSLPERRLA